MERITEQMGMTDEEMQEAYTTLREFMLKYAGNMDVGLRVFAETLPDYPPRTAFMLGFILCDLETQALCQTLEKII